MKVIKRRPIDKRFSFMSSHALNEGRRGKYLRSVGSFKNNLSGDTISATVIVL